jgi:two-component system cell cycle sensor histidine kinase/response regulator CckA
VSRPIETAPGGCRVEPRLAAALAAVGDAVVCTDPSGAVNFLNAAAEMLTGWPAEEALGKDAAQVIRLLDEETHRQVADPVADALRDAASRSLVLAARDGSEAPVAGRVALLPGDRGEPAGVVVVVRDLSDRRLAQEQLGDAQKREGLGRLAAALGHDLQNLLTAVLGNVALARAALAKDDPNQEVLAAAEQAGERAGRLLADLGRCTRSLPFQPQGFDPSVSLRDAARLLRRTLDPRYTVEVRLGPDLWPVRGDSAHLRNALVALARNACASMRAGGRLRLEADNAVLVEAPTLPQARRGEFIRLRVIDTGPGLPGPIRRWLGEPLALPQELVHGTCAGLALVRDIVRQHRGWVEHHDALPHGTRFDVYLPRHSQEPANVPLARPRPKGRAASVLLATGDAMLGHLGRLILLHQGYDVFVARDGGEALDLYRHRKDRTDLVILDGTLPGLGASDIVRQLAQLDPHVRVLIAGDAAPAGGPGISGPHLLGCVRTPFRPHELAEVVRAALHG